VKWEETNHTRDMELIKDMDTTDADIITIMVIGGKTTKIYII